MWKRKASSLININLLLDEFQTDFLVLIFSPFIFNISEEYEYGLIYGYLIRKVHQMSCIGKYLKQKKKSQKDLVRKTKKLYFQNRIKNSKNITKSISEITNEKFRETRRNNQIGEVWENKWLLDGCQFV